MEQDKARRVTELMNEFNGLNRDKHLIEKGVIGDTRDAVITLMGQKFRVVDREYIKKILLSHIGMRMKEITEELARL